MEQEEHHIQDAAEHYAVFVMQRRAEEIGVASAPLSSDLELRFRSYLSGVNLTAEDFSEGRYPRYKNNVDQQVPAFVDRLAEHFPGATLDFENVEAEYRNLGLKGDFLIKVGGLNDPKAVSLKNYVGGSGISRPQVASGTFASFAASFIFERVGVGVYSDPRTVGSTFAGSNATVRNEILTHMGRGDLIPILAVLDKLQAEVRAEFLGPDCEFYDGERVRSAVQRIAQPGIDAVLQIFATLGIEDVRRIFLARIGLDGKEEALYFDSSRYVDSITNHRYHEFRVRLNDPATRFTVTQHGQGIRFAFVEGSKTLLATDVPFTINTNGAWYRPRPRFEGSREYNDKGHAVSLLWGQRRPYKSKEIATSVNTYLNLVKAGIFIN